MPITETPKVRYYEVDSDPTLTGEGAQIPIFIGISNNETPTAGIQKFKNYNACNKEVALGGLGLDTKTNPLLKAINEFFQESQKTRSTDISVPYIYVIDLGKCGIATSTGVSKWLEAMDLAKSKREIQVEVYVGFTNTDKQEDVVAIMKSALESIKKDSEFGNPRCAYYTIEGTTDATIVTYTDESLGSGKYTQNVRAGLIEPKYFGKSVARICVTPYYQEPGYEDFRSIEPGEFSNRSHEDGKVLQDAGIIFINDEIASQELHPRINLAVSTAFAANEDSRPNDALLHARRNVDQLIREVYDLLYTQLKRNETETNFSYLQSDIDILIDDKITAGYMMDGTYIELVEDPKDPYNLEVQGKAKPVNCTTLIGFSMFIDVPNATVTKQ